MRLADRLAVVPGLGDGEQLEVLLDAVGDLVEDVGALGHRGLAPGGSGGVRGVEGGSMSSAVPRAISVNVLPVTGEMFSKYSPFSGATHSPPMKWSYRLSTVTFESADPGAANTVMLLSQRQWWIRGRAPGAVRAGPSRVSNRSTTTC